jgi:hypothetical protein
VAGKSTLCCFDAYFLDFVVNVLEETSKNERTEDNFQEGFHNTESEEEASDDKSSDCNNSNDNNGEDGYFSVENFVWFAKFPALEFTILFYVFVDQLQRKNWKRRLYTKGLDILFAEAMLQEVVLRTNENNCTVRKKYGEN